MFPVDDRWRRAVQTAAAAWTGLDGARFLAHAEAQRAAEGAAGEHLADLALAFAAAEGLRDAIAALDARLLAAVRVGVRRLEPSTAFLDDVAQELRAALLVERRLLGYQARGPLTAWLRVAALRVALNLVRGRRATVSDDEVLEHVASEPDPELKQLARLYRAELATALRQALAALPERSRLLLRLHHVEGLRLAQIGALYAVHESTASRWIKLAVEELAADVQRRVRARLAISRESFESLARLVASGLDVSVARLLGGPA